MRDRIKKAVVVLGFGTFISLYVSCGIRDMFKEVRAFAGAIVRDHKTMGTFVPSSSYVAKEMAHKISYNKAEPIHVLEVGGGSGSITEQIVSKLRDSDSLDVVELDRELFEVLKRKFSKYKNVTIHCSSILDWQTDVHYDFIVSSLPFNSFEPLFVNKVMKRYLDLIKKDGVVSYLEYMALAYIKKFFLGSQKQKDFMALHNLLAGFRKLYKTETRNVYFNVPPAYVHHIEINKDYGPHGEMRPVRY